MLKLTRHPNRYAEEAKHGIGQASEAGKVVAVGKVAHTVDKRHSWYQRHDSANDDVGKTLAKVHAPAQHTQQSGHQRIAHATHNFRQIAVAHSKHKHIEQHTHHQGSGTIEPSTPEHGTEATRTKSRTQNLLPRRLLWRVADALQSLACLGKGCSPIRNVIAQAVDRHHLRELNAPQRYEFDVGIGRRLSTTLSHLVGAASSKDAIRQYKEVARVHTKVRRDATHYVLDT